VEKKTDIKINFKKKGGKKDHAADEEKKVEETSSLSKLVLDDLE